MYEDFTDDNLISLTSRIKGKVIEKIYMEGSFGNNLIIVFNDGYKLEINHDWLYGFELEKEI